MIAAIPIMAHATTATLTVMSYNVRYGSAEDGENHWLNRREMLVESIRRHEPGIIGTQECLTFQAVFIVESMPDYRWFGAARGADGNGELCAVIYDARSYRPLRSGDFWLSANPDTPGSRGWDAALPRVATWAHFQDVRTGAQFILLNTHYDHIGIMARVNSSGAILDRLAVINPDALPVVLTGDFNSPAGSPPWRKFINAGFRDAWQETDRREGPAQTFHGFNGPMPGVEVRIDWILVGGAARVTSCLTDDYNRDGRYPSDHLPLVVEFEIPAPDRFP